MHLLGDSHTRAVELSNKVGILAINLVSKNEIGCPDEWNRHALHSQARHDLREILVNKVLHQLGKLWIIRLVGHVLGTRLQGGRDTALSWLLVNNLGWLVINHVHTKLTLDNTRQESLVDQLTVLTNNVLLAESHEVINGLLLLVVVDSLLQVQKGLSGHWTFLSFLDLTHPDTFTLRTAVLLHHTDSSGNALWEVLLEAWNIVVGIGIGHTARQVGDLDESVLGSHLLHHIWVLHWGNTLGSRLPKHTVQLALGNTRVGTRVDSGDETITGIHEGFDLVVLRVRVVHWNALPVLLDQGIGDWNSIPSVTVSLLVASSLALDEDNLS